MARDEQLFLDLPLAPASAREDLVIGEPNRMAVNHLDAWPQWDAQLTVLAGPVGSGKTHLAKVWALRSGGTIVRPENLTASDAASGERSFVLEDIDTISFDEKALFHLLNATRANGQTGLITSRSWPRSWNIGIPDLSSRLRSATIVEIHEPDDVMLRGVLMKLFADRQLAVDPGVVDYLVVRMERSLATATEIVKRLDYLSLTRRRPVTRPLAADALAMENGATGRDG